MADEQYILIVCGSIEGEFLLEAEALDAADAVEAGMRRDAASSLEWYGDESIVVAKVLRRMEVRPVQSEGEIVHDDLLAVVDGGKVVQRQ